MSMESIQLAMNDAYQPYRDEGKQTCSRKQGWEAGRRRPGAFFLKKSFNGSKKNRRARRKGHVVTSGCELEQIILNSRRLVLIAAHEEFLLKKNLVQKIVLNINS